MRVLIQSAAVLPLPSASGIEIVGDVAYVIGDDVPCLYLFRATDLSPLGRIVLFEVDHLTNGRLPKTVKPDLEAMTLLSGYDQLVAIGSGATPARERAFLIMPSKGAAVARVAEHSLAVLYAAFRQHLPVGMLLNIEALAATPHGVLFFQRPAGTTAGRIGFLVPQGEAVLQGKQQSADFSTFYYQLPEIEGYPAGLSGATWFEDQLFITASVEVTSDPVLDGEVLGSLIGVMDRENPESSRFVQLAWPDGRPFREKVEGIAVRSRLPDGSYDVVLVTDDDQGNSMGIVGRLYC